MNRREFLKCLTVTPLFLSLTTNKSEGKIVLTEEDAFKRLKEIQGSLLSLELYFEEEGCLLFACECFDIHTLADLNLETFKDVLREVKRSRGYSAVQERFEETLDYYFDTIGR